MRTGLWDGPIQEGEYCNATGGYAHLLAGDEADVPTVTVPRTWGPNAWEGLIAWPGTNG